MRVNFVNKARKAPGNCFRCGMAIGQGEPYRWFKFNFGPKRVYCEQHNPRPSEMTSSDKLARLYAAQEGIAEAILSEDKEAIVTALEEAMNTAQEVGEEYEESLNNMPEGLQQGLTGEEIQEKVDACSSWESELSSALGEVEDLELGSELYEAAERASDALEI